MFRRYALGFSSVGRGLSTMSSSTPVEDLIRAKVCLTAHVPPCLKLQPLALSCKPPGYEY